MDILLTLFLVSLLLFMFQSRGLFSLLLLLSFFLSGLLCQKPPEADRRLGAGAEPFERLLQPLHGLFGIRPVGIAARARRDAELKMRVRFDGKEGNGSRVVPVGGRDLMSCPFCPPIFCNCSSRLSPRTLDVPSRYAVLNPLWGRINHIAIIYNI